MFSGSFLEIAMVLAAIYGVATLSSRLYLRLRRSKGRRAQTKHRKEAAYSVRPFVVEDASAVIGLSAKLNRTGWRILDRGVALTRLEAAARQQGGLHVFVAEQEGAIAGYAGLQIVPYGTYANSAYLTELFVLPEFRRNGIATALFETAVERAREKEVSLVRWHVLPRDEEALAFYRKLGATWDPHPQLGLLTNAFLRAAVKKSISPPGDAPEWSKEAAEGAE